MLKFNEAAFKKAMGMDLEEAVKEYGDVNSAMAMFESLTAEAFVSDLGVDVDPDKFYVMSDAGTMYGGVENAFDDEASALNYAMQDAEGFDPDVDQVVKGSDIIAAYQAESKLVQEANDMQTRAMIQALGSEAEASGDLGEKVAALILQAGKENRINASSYEGILTKLPSEALEALYTKAVGFGMKGATVDRTDGSFDQKMAMVDFLKGNKELIKQLSSLPKNDNPIYRGANSVFNLSPEGYTQALEIARKAGFNESMEEKLTVAQWKEKVLASFPDAQFTQEDGSGKTYGEVGGWTAHTGPDMQADVVGIYSKDFCSIETEGSMMGSDDTLEYGVTGGLNESGEDGEGGLSKDRVINELVDEVGQAMEDSSADAFNGLMAFEAEVKGSGKDFYSWDELAEMFDRHGLNQDDLEWFRSMNESDDAGDGVPFEDDQATLGESDLDLSGYDAVEVATPTDASTRTKNQNAYGFGAGRAHYPVRNAFQKIRVGDVVAWDEYQGVGKGKVKAKLKGGTVETEDGQILSTMDVIAIYRPKKGVVESDPVISEGSEIVSTHEYRGKSADVYKEPSGKFRVRFYRDGKPMPQNTDLVTKEKDKAQAAAKQWIAESFGQFVVDSVLGNEQGVALVAFREGTSDQGDYAVVMNPDGRIMEGAPLPKLSAMVSTHSSFNDALSKFQNKVAEVAKSDGGSAEFPVIGLQIDDPLASVTEGSSIVSTHEYRGKSADVYKEPSGKFRVRFYRDGKPMPQNTDLVTKDKSKAQAAARGWIAENRKSAVVVASAKSDLPNRKYLYNVVDEKTGKVIAADVSGSEADRIADEYNGKSKGVNESFQTSPFEAAGLNVDYNEDRTKAIIHVKDEAQFLKFQKAIDLFGGQDAIGKFEYKVSEGEDELYTIEVELKQYDSGKDSARFMKEMDPNGQQK